jgi:hypothetical protein
VLAAMPDEVRDGIVAAMETPSQTNGSGCDLATAPCRDEDELVREWREEQLRRLGVLPTLARAFADSVDWHDIASLVQRGCPPLLALEIVR